MFVAAVMVHRGTEGMQQVREQVPLEVQVGIWISKPAATFTLLPFSVKAEDKLTFNCKNNILTAVENVSNL